MIFFSKLLRQGGGNFGNAMWQMASSTGLGKRYNVPVKFPENSLFQYFKNPPDTYSRITSSFYANVKEKTYKFDWSQWDEEDFENFDADITGWLQDQRYWEHCREEVYKMFELKDEYVAWIRAKYSHVFTKPTIAISVRRGDYVNNPHYELLPIRYYLGALLTHFPDFRDNYNLVVFSDDIEYCKLHFGKHAFYAEGDAIEQHTLMRQCDNFVLSNSTFAYWGAKLANVGKVIVPKYLFAGSLLEREGDVNFWSTEGWTEFDHKNYKIDLNDTTFTIPCYHDHHDREENLTLAVKMLKEDFNTHIIIGENQSNSFSHLGDRYMKFNYPEFHRTRMLNQMAYKATTPIIVNFDADIVIPPLQILNSVLKVRGGHDMVYPYDGRFARVPRSNYPSLNKLRDVGIFGGKSFRGLNGQLSVGGAIVFNKQSFLKGGGENENFRSYGPEDRERYHRFTTLGFNVDRVRGPVYHIDHEITLNSSIRQPNYESNKNEWEMIERMGKEELEQYVKSWDFTSRYDETYHEEIKDTTSAPTVLNILKDWIEFNNIVDFGCGNKSWDTGLCPYTGIDFNVPGVDIDADLRLPLDVGRYDLCISTEVAEHLPESDTFIDNLCRASDQILFSAAIPGQEGENHINCHWQSYWAAKFKERGFYPFYKDIRTPVWNNEDVAPWYRQNMVLYTKNLPTREYELDKVHPRMYSNALGLN